MAAYLITKEEFVTLYKYGRLHVRANSCASGPDRLAEMETLLHQSDVFEYAQERLFVTTEAEASEVLEMTSVTGIHPLDSVSKRVFEGEFNGKILFSDPVCEDMVKQFLTEDTGHYKAIQGINALYRIFGLDDEPEKEIVDQVIKGLEFRRHYKYYDIPLDVRSPWSMLIAYDRYRNYPNNGCTGYFFDMIDATLYGSMPRPELLGFDEDIVREMSGIVSSELDKLRGKGFRDIVNAISLREDLNINGFITKQYGSPFLPALFFFAKEKIRKGGDEMTVESLKVLKRIGDEYPELFPRLLTLIGGFFGYTWIYDRYYEALGLPFVRNTSSIRMVLDGAPDEGATETAPEPAAAEEPASPETPPVEGVPEDLPDQETGAEDSPQEEGTEVPPEEPEPESPAVTAEEGPAAEQPTHPGQGGDDGAEPVEPAGQEPQPVSEVPAENVPDKVEEIDGEEPAQPVAPEEGSESGQEEECFIDMFGRKQTFSEFATDAYLKSISKITAGRSAREAWFRDFLGREGARKVLFDAVKSGQQFQLTALRRKIDPKFSDPQWAAFKSEIMKFNKG